MHIYQDHCAYSQGFIYFLDKLIEVIVYGVFW